DAHGERVSELGNRRGRGEHLPRVARVEERIAVLEALGQLREDGLEPVGRYVERRVRGEGGPARPPGPQPGQARLEGRELIVWLHAARLPRGRSQAVYRASWRSARQAGPADPCAAGDSRYSGRAGP